MPRSGPRRVIWQICACPARPDALDGAADPDPVVIIGAGISGLAAARALIDAGVPVQVVEARNRIGGRALSHDIAGGGAVDLGPAWVWPDVQPVLAHQLQALGLSVAPQYERGALMFDSAGGVRPLQVAPRYGDAARISGGTARLAAALGDGLPPGALILDARVVAVELPKGAPGVQLHLSNGGILAGRAVISAVPPRLAALIDWRPGLDAPLMQALRATPTWMAAHAKFIALYPAPFWRLAGLSGAAVSEIGPLFEIADHTPDEGGSAALFGFSSWPAAQRRDNPQGFRDAALAQLARLFGPEAAKPTDVIVHDWAQDPATAGPGDDTDPGGHPIYGDPQFGRVRADGRLAFAGAETARQSGGLINGALIAGQRAARQILAAMPLSNPRTGPKRLP